MDVNKLGSYWSVVLAGCYMFCTSESPGERGQSMRTRDLTAAAMLHLHSLSFFLLYRFSSLTYKHGVWELVYLKLMCKARKYTCKKVHKQKL